jgi:hypothetical protein
MSNTQNVKDSLFERMKERYPAANNRKLEKIVNDVVESRKK